MLIEVLDPPARTRSAAMDESEQRAAFVAVRPGIPLPGPIAGRAPYST
jgi:hypothetical protein